MLVPCNKAFGILEFCFGAINSILNQNEYMYIIHHRFIILNYTYKRNGDCALDVVVSLQRDISKGGEFIKYRLSN